MLQNVFGALLLGGGLAAVAGGAWLVHRGRNWHATLDRFDGPTTVDALEPGPVALTGTVHAAADTEPVTGPLSGAEGVVAESRVTPGGGGLLARSRRRRRILDRQADSTPFVLDDATGRVRVELPDAPDPDGWSLQPADWLSGRLFWGLDFDLVETTRRARLSWGVPDAGRFRELHAPFDTRFGPDELPPGQRRRYAERVVQPGEEVFVFGEASRTEAGWDAPEWTVTADDPESVLLSDSFATRAGRDDARRERAWSERIGYAFGGSVLLLGLFVTAASVVFAPDPLVAAGYLLAGLPVLAVALAATVRGVDLASGASFVARSLGSGGAIGLGLLAAGGYLLSQRPPGTLLSAAAWPAYALLAAGAFFLWGAVSAFLYVQYGIDLPLRGKLPGDE